MPIIQALQVKQTTASSGTGTVTLIAATSGFRSFQDGYGSSPIVVRYAINSPGGWERGIGTFSGGSPGTLSRDVVLASSAGGFAVSLSGVSDVYGWVDPGDRFLLESTATSLTLSRADLGNTLIWSGTARGTTTLPAIAGVPFGTGFVVVNRGTAALVVDPNGTETINGRTTFVLLPGTRVEVIRGNAGWEISHGDAYIGDIVEPAPSSGGITFDVPADWTAARFRITGIVTDTTAAALLLRVRRAGQPNDEDTSGDYRVQRLFRARATAANAVISSDDATDTGAVLIPSIGNGSAYPASCEGIIYFGGTGLGASVISNFVSFDGTAFDQAGTVSSRVVDTGKVDRVRLRLFGSSTITAMQYIFSRHS